MKAIYTNNRNDKMVVNVLGNGPLFGKECKKGRMFVQKETAQGMHGIFSAKESELEMI